MNLIVWKKLKKKKAGRSDDVGGVENSSKEYLQKQRKTG